MTPMISNFRLAPDRLSLSWTSCAQAISKSYRFPVVAANELRDAHGIAVVESFDESAPQNAVVLNSDGSERFRVLSPLPDGQVQGFADLYYVNEELTAILVIPGCDFAVVVDETTGKCLRYYETR